MAIIGHHAPILLLVLPLSIPIWADLRHYDSDFFRMLDLDESNPFRQRLLGGYLLANGLGFISSFNEVLMCFQRVEMNIEGVSNFKQNPRMKNRIFSSRVFIGVERIKSEPVGFYFDYEPKKHTYFQRFLVLIKFHQ